MLRWKSNYHILLVKKGIGNCKSELYAPINEVRACKILSAPDQHLD